MGEVAVIDDDSNKGLTLKQKQYATELMVGLFQGKTPAQKLEILGKMERFDDERFIKSLLNSALAHPQFEDPDNVIDNLHKQALIRSQLMKIKHSVKRDDAQTQKTSIEVLNALRNSQFKDANYSEKFGKKRSIFIERDKNPRVVGEKYDYGE